MRIHFLAIESQAKKIGSHLSWKIFSWITSFPDQRRVWTANLLHEVSQWVSGLDNYFAWERFEVQTLEQDTIAVWILAHGWGISNLILYYKWNKEVGIVKKSFSEIKFLTPFSNSFTFIITHASLIISYFGRRDSMS